MTGIFYSASCGIDRRSRALARAKRIAYQKRREFDNNNVTNKKYIMTSNFTFQIYYSNDFKLYDLVINSNNQFHSHYHLTNKKDINKIINKLLKQLTK